MLDMVVQRLALWAHARARVTRPAALTVEPHVSVVVPCYNYGKFLPACVGSVLTQAGVSVDVLIVDDASTDDSAEVAEAIAAGDPRVKLHRNEQNRGHIASYNYGFSRTTGEYVLLLSADDLLTPGALARASALMAAYPSVGFTYGWSVPFSGDCPSDARTRTRSWCVWRGIDWVTGLCRRGGNVIRSSDAVVRRSVLERVGGYREDLPHSGDHEWWMRAALVADVGMVCGVDQLYYRLHGRNMSRTPNYASALANLHETMRAFDAVLGDKCAGNGELRALGRTAHRALARKALQLAIAECMVGSDGFAAAHGYMNFALAADPRVAESREWRTLQRPMRVGARARPSPAFRARACAVRARRHVEWRRWRFTGI